MSSHSAMQCRLSSTYVAEWKFMNIQNNCFNGYHNREAVLVENKIVYFGNWHKKATFVLERDEESEQLQVVRED